MTFCTVTGWQNGQFVQITDARKIYHQRMLDENWSAIQITTAAGVCAVLDLYVNGTLPTRGLLRQEQIDFEAFMKNRFGRLFDSDITSGPTGNKSSLAAFST